MIRRLTSTGGFWIGLVIFFLMIPICLFSFAIYATTSDPAHAVVDDYYEKAVNWEQTQRLRAESAALGWTVAIDGLEATPPGDTSLIRLSLTGPDDLPVEGCSVQIIAFHNARSKNRIPLTLRPIEPGVYGAPIDASRAGWWEIQVSALRGADRFVSTERVFIHPRKEGGAS